MHFIVLIFIYIFYNFIMSIFNKKNSPKPPEGKDIQSMLKKLVSESQKEYNNIENFLDILYEERYINNFEILNMNLEKFIEYLEKEEGKLYSEITLEKNTQKITLLFKKLNQIEQLKNFINNYIAIAKNTPQKNEFFNINPKETTLKVFIEILKSRQKYLSALFQK